VGTASVAQSLALMTFMVWAFRPSLPTQNEEEIRKEEKRARAKVLSNINSRHSNHPRSQQRNKVKQSNKKKLMAFSLLLYL
jgi:hypothetical protein